MKRITTFSAAMILAAMPAFADEPADDLSEGAELLSEGTRLILRGLMAHMEPAAEGWGILIEKLNDFSLFEVPEVLPNGDIIIRRKEPLEGEAGETDL